MCRIARCGWRPNGARCSNRASEDSLVDIVRGRLEGLGPVTAAHIAASLGLTEAQINGALVALEAEGFAMRGRFHARASVGGRMVRAPLAGTHSSLHGQTAAGRNRTGAMPGISCAFCANGSACLPECADAGLGCAGGGTRAARGLRSAGRRLGDRRSSRRGSPNTSRNGWMSIAAQAASSGRAWRRAAARAATRRLARGASPVRSTPITFARAGAMCRCGRRLPTSPIRRMLTSRAQAVADFIREHGASFFDEIAEHVGMLPVGGRRCAG